MTNVLKNCFFIALFLAPITSLPDTPLARITISPIENYEELLVLLIFNNEVTNVKYCRLYNAGGSCINVSSVCAHGFFLSLCYESIRYFFRIHARYLVNSYLYSYPVYNIHLTNGSK